MTALPPRLLASRAVVVGDLAASGLDVVVCGVLTGAWTDLEQRLAAGLALEATQEVAPGELAAEVVALRRRRRLLSAADFRGWLGERDLTLTEVERCATRALLRARCSGAEGTALGPEAAQQLYPEAIYDGTFGRCAADLGRRMVAAGRSAVAASPAPDPRVDAWFRTSPLQALVTGQAVAASALRVQAWDEALRALSTRVSVEAAVQACVAEHTDDWVRVEAEALTFSTAGQAREARMLLTEGTSPAELAPLARAWFELTLFVEEANDALKIELLRTRGKGGAVAWPDADVWKAAVVRRRTPPVATDEAIGARARERLIDRELTKLGAGKVLIDVAV